jgi:hypothetical protein
LYQIYKILHSLIHGRTGRKKLGGRKEICPTFSDCAHIVQNCCRGGGGGGGGCRPLRPVRPWFNMTFFAFLTDHNVMCLNLIFTEHYISASTPEKIISFPTAQNFLIFDKNFSCTKVDEFYLV